MGCAFMTHCFGITVHDVFQAVQDLLSENLEDDEHCVVKAIVDDLLVAVRVKDERLVSIVDQITDCVDCGQQT